MSNDCETNLHMCEGLYGRYAKGQISGAAWEPYEKSLAGLFATQFLTSWWATDMRRLYTEAFRDYVEKDLSNVEGRWSQPRASTLAGSSESRKTGERT